MQMMFPLLGGILFGILVTRWLQSKAYHRALRSYHTGNHYAPARRAVARHLRARGTLNRVQLVRMMDIDETSAQQYLDRMVIEGLLAHHGHRGGDAFYTLK